MTHLSELAIDKLLANELLPLEQTRLRDHAVSCWMCRVALEDAETAKARFADEMPPLLLPTRVPPARKPSRVWLAAPALAAAAAIAIVVWSRGTAPEGAQGERPEAVETVRTKGGSIAGMFVSHAGVVRRGAASETVMPGDRLAFVTTTTEPMWFAVVSDDQAGARSVYVVPTRVPAGRELELPLSIELDDALGAESVTAVFCAEPFDAHLEIPASCTREHFALTKVRR